MDVNGVQPGSILDQIGKARENREALMALALGTCAHPACWDREGHWDGCQYADLYGEDE